MKLDFEDTGLKEDGFQYTAVEISSGGLAVVEDEDIIYTVENITCTI